MDSINKFEYRNLAKQKDIDGWMHACMDGWIDRW